MAAPTSTLPHELMKQLPTDPAAMLAQGNQIVMQAFAKLQAENAALRNTFARSQKTIQELEKRVAAADGQVRSVEQKLAVVSAERDSLGAEKSALIATVRRLNGEIAKTDSLKASIMQTLQNQPSSDSTATYADPSSYQRTAETPALPSTLPIEAPSSPPPTSTTPAVGRMPPPSPLSDTYAASHPSSTYTPYTPYTPYTTTFGAYSPQAPYSPAPPDSSPSAAFTRSIAVRGGGGGGEAHKGRVDGKEFFRQARARLAPEAFSRFLQNIKDLNAHKKTHPEALASARALFGAAGEDLYQTFESMIGRHLL